MVISSNKDVAGASLIYLHGNNIEDSDKQDIFSNTEFEAIINSIKNELLSSAHGGFCE